MKKKKKIELFDKWYDENYDEWAEGEEGIALREELEQAFKGGIAELEKENAELKERFKHRNCLDCSNHHINIKLFKAKEIIREFVEWATWQGNSKCPSFKSIQDKAEQFLNSEVEK